MYNKSFLELKWGFCLCLSTGLSTYRIFRASLGLRVMLALSKHDSKANPPVSLITLPWVEMLYSSGYGPRCMEMEEY